VSPPNYIEEGNTIGNRMVASKITEKINLRFETTEVHFSGEQPKNTIEKIIDSHFLHQKPLMKESMAQLGGSILLVLTAP
jgi:hypothetical protein